MEQQKAVLIPMVSIVAYAHDVAVEVAAVESYESEPPQLAVGLLHSTLDQYAHA